MAVGRRLLWAGSGSLCHHNRRHSLLLVVPSLAPPSPPPCPSPNQLPLPKFTVCAMWVYRFSIILNFPTFVDLSWRGLVLGNERRWGWSKLLLFLPGALTFGLGTWQIFRRQDKVTYTHVHTLAFAPICVCEIFRSFR